jgi:hypothetical protein
MPVNFWRAPYAFYFRAPTQHPAPLIVGIPCHCRGEPSIARPRASAAMLLKQWPVELRNEPWAERRMAEFGSGLGGRGSPPSARAVGRNIRSAERSSRLPRAHLPGEDCLEVDDLAPAPVTICADRGNLGARRRTFGSSTIKVGASRRRMANKD